MMPYPSWREMDKVRPRRWNFPIYSSRPSKMPHADMMKMLKQSQGILPRGNIPHSDIELPKRWELWWCISRYLFSSVVSTLTATVSLDIQYKWDYCKYVVKIIQGQLVFYMSSCLYFALPWLLGIFLHGTCVLIKVFKCAISAKFCFDRQVLDWKRFSFITCLSQIVNLKHWRVVGPL